MPKYTPSQDEEELYGGVKPPGQDNVPRGTDEAPPPTDGPPNPDAKEGEPTEPQTTDEEMAESQNSAVVSNKVLVGPDGQAPKEGDEITLKVIKVYGDECEVAYATEPTGPGEGPMSGVNTEIDAMDQKGL